MTDLKENFAGYTGNAVEVVFKPKGGGDQDGLLVDGSSYGLVNSKTYDFQSPSPYYMTVHLYNDKINAQGKAVGHWQIALASTQGTLVVY